MRMASEGSRFAEPPESAAGHPEASQLARQWAVVQDAGAAVASIAGIAPENPGPRVRTFFAQLQAVGGARLRLAENHVADMAAILQPGLAALLAVGTRGQDISAPALALWQEYHEAREAMLALVPDDGAAAPHSHS